MGNTEPARPLIAIRDRQHSDGTWQRWYVLYWRGAEFAECATYAAAERLYADLVATRSD